MRVANLATPLPLVSAVPILALLSSAQGGVRVSAVPFLALFPASQGGVRRAQVQGNSAPCIGGKPSGCGKGLWSDATCRCECAPTICRNATGSCSDSSGQCDAGNPWEDCSLGTDYPWWDNDKRKAKSCTTRRYIPPGVWDLFATEAECCAAKHPNAAGCVSQTGKAPPPPPPSVSPTTRASMYEIVAIEFHVSGLPEEVDEEALRVEAEEVLRWVLVLDLAERVPGLKVTTVEERAAPKLSAGRALFHYDITMLRHQDRDKKFAPLIISELRNTYEEVIADVEAYTDMRYFGKGIDFVWCVEDQCSVKERIALIWDPVKFNVPRKISVDMDDFLGQLEVIYEAHLQGIEKLDILDIKFRIDEGAKQTKDIILSVAYAEKYQMVDLEPAINDRIKQSMSNISVEIEAYLLSQTGAGTNWYRNSKGAYTLRTKVVNTLTEEVEWEEEEEEEEEEEMGEVEKVKKPPSTIIILAIFGLLVLCLLVWFAVHQSKKRSRYKDEWRPTSHATSSRSSGSGSASPHFLDRRDRSNPLRERQRQRSYEMGQERRRRRRRRRKPCGEEKGGRAAHPRRPRATPIVDGALPHRRRDDTLCALENAASFDFGNVAEEDRGRPGTLRNVPDVATLRPGSAVGRACPKPRDDALGRLGSGHEEPRGAAAPRPGPSYEKPRTGSATEQPAAEEYQSVRRPDPEGEVSPYQDCRPARPKIGGHPCGVVRE